MYKDKENLGGRLARCREKASLSQRQLGKLAEKEFGKDAFSWQSISKWESNEVIPSPEYLNQLAVLFDVKTSWLLTGIRTRNDADNKLLNSYHGLAREDQKMVDALIRNFQNKYKTEGEGR